jgi:hypothetical protein
MLYPLSAGLGETRGQDLGTSSVRVERHAVGSVARPLAGTRMISVIDIFGAAGKKRQG